MFSDVLKKIRDLWTRLIHTDALTLAAVVMTIIAAWCFLEVADEVTEGETRWLDEWVVRSLRHPTDPSNPLGPPWLEEVIRDLTALGGITVLVLVIGAVAGYSIGSDNTFGSESGTSGRPMGNDHGAGCPTLPSGPLSELSQGPSTARHEGVDGTASLH